MRTLLALLPLAAACQQVPGREDLQARSLEVADSLLRGDVRAGATLASADASSFFEACQKLRVARGEDLAFEVDPTWEVEVVEVTTHEGRGHAILRCTGARPGELLLEFVPEDGEWRLDAVSGDPKKPTHRLAQVTPQVQEIVDAILRPHPGAAPVVEAYLAAAGRKDLAGMTSLLSEECRAAQGQHHSPTRYFLADLRIDRWEFAGHGEDGRLDDDGNLVDEFVHQVVSLELIDGNGVKTHDPMYFRLRVLDGAWTITRIDLAGGGSVPIRFWSLR